MLGDRRGEVLHRDPLASGEHYGALECVLELSHIAGPVPCLQGIECFGGEPLDLATVSLRLLQDEVLGEQRDVIGALSERGQVQPGPGWRLR